MDDPPRDPADGRPDEPEPLPAGEPDAGPVPVARLIDRRGRCRLVYEPIADLAHGTICGFEAVERFPGAVDPEAWREEALRRGLEPDLDAFVVASVLHARESLPDGCFLSFNTRPATLLREPVKRVLARARSLDGLVIELRPRLARRDAARFSACVAELRAAGARFAVDDIGGDDGVLRHSALLRPELGKLDGLLVTDLDRTPAKRILLYEIERIASRFGAALVAQGVRRVEELEALMRLRVPLAQGPLIGVRAKTLTPIAFPLSRYVRERGAAVLRPGTLAPLVERVPGVPAAEPAAATAAFAADASLTWVVLLDARGRPAALHERGACARAEPPVAELLGVGAGSGVVEAAQRALTRPPQTRFHPLVCCEASGAYAGVVPFERLVEALAGVADGALERGAQAPA